MSKRFTRFTAAMTMLFAVVATALVSPSTYGADDVAVSNAWARATAPGQRTASVYMEIMSRSHAAIVSVSSPDARSSEIHQSRMEGGIMKMRRVERLALPAKKPVSLSPGGLHLMLIDIARPMQPKQKVTVELTVEDGQGKRSGVIVQAEVRAAASAAHHAH